MTHPAHLSIWQRCEIAWAEWLANQGYAVVLQMDLLNNTPLTKAPMTILPRGQGVAIAPDIRASRDGVSVTAPRQLSISAITQFVQTKIDWIQQKRAAIVNTTPIAAPDTTHAWVWGVQYPMHITHGPRAQVALTDTHLILTAPATSTPAQHAAMIQRNTVRTSS